MGTTHETYDCQVVRKIDKSETEEVCFRYEDKAPEQLALHMTKYGKREGYSHRGENYGS